MFDGIARLLHKVSFNFTGVCHRWNFQTLTLQISAISEPISPAPRIVISFFSFDDFNPCFVLKRNFFQGLFQNLCKNENILKAVVGRVGASRITFGISPIATTPFYKLIKTLCASPRWIKKDKLTASFAGSSWGNNFQKLPNTSVEFVIKYSKYPVVFHFLSAIWDSCSLKRYPKRPDELPKPRMLNSANCQAIKLHALGNKPFLHEKTLLLIQWPTNQQSGKSCRFCKYFSMEH